MGRRHNVCPYYYSRNATTLADAEVVFVPYNYIIDRNARRGLDIAWDNCVVIFDEAHNLDKVCADSASFDLTAADLALCMEEMDQVFDLVQRGESLAGVDAQHGPLLPEVTHRTHTAGACLSPKPTSRLCWVA